LPFKNIKRLLNCNICKHFSLCINKRLPNSNSSNNEQSAFIWICGACRRSDPQIPR